MNGSDRAVDQIAEMANAYGAKEPVMRSVYKATGYDGIKSKGFGGSDQAGGDITVAWFPEQIRSKKAKFDPKKKDSANILAGTAGAVVAGSLASKEKGSK